MNVNDRLANAGITVKGNFALFWGGVFSNWYKSRFVLDDIEYNCVEQYMMAQKAITFKDARSLKAIMETSDPSKQKHYGRTVKNYNDDDWKLIKYPVVVKACIAKFDQNPHLLPVLLDSYPLILVEASKVDNQWGIAMGSDHKYVTNPACWNGQNLQGLALMDARAAILLNSDD